MPAFKSWNPFSDQLPDEKLVGHIALPVTEHLEGVPNGQCIGACRGHTSRSTLRNLVQFSLALFAFVCLARLAWFTTPSSQNQQSTSDHKLEDDPRLKHWVMTTYGSKNGTTCDREMGKEIGFVPKECSPVGTYVQIEGVNWENNGDFELCLYDSPGCDRDLKASYVKSGSCLDANGSVTYRVMIAGENCKAHSWT